MVTLVHDLYVLSSILGPPLWRIMTSAQGPHTAKSGPDHHYNQETSQLFVLDSSQVILKYATLEKLSLGSQD